MAKQRFTMNNFSGGINSVKDPRDIGINEFAFLQGFVVDQDGALRPMINGPNNSSSNHDGKFTNTSINGVGCVVKKSGGNNLAYMESDIDLFFQGGQYGGTYSTTSNVAIDFIKSSESDVGEGETTAPKRKGVS
mgnify:FL=1